MNVSNERRIHPIGPSMMMNEFYYLKGFAVEPSGEWVLDTEIEIDWKRLLLGRGEGVILKKMHCITFTPIRSCGCSKKAGFIPKGEPSPFLDLVWFHNDEVRSNM